MKMMDWAKTVLVVALAIFTMAGISALAGGGFLLALRIWGVGALAGGGAWIGTVFLATAIAKKYKLPDSGALAVGVLGGLLVSAPLAVTAALYLLRAVLGHM